MHSPSFVAIALSGLTCSTLIGCANPASPGGQLPARSETTASQRSPLNPQAGNTSAVCGNLPQPLTKAEREYAAAAWQYFVNNRQPATGFSNAANDYPSGTLWDQGNYLMALNAALWFEFITVEEFDAQLNQFLTSLAALPLVAGALPNKVYNSATGTMVDYTNQPTATGLGWSALDIGRMLAALHIIRTCHPRYDDWISGIVDSWQVARSIQNGQLYGAVVNSDGDLQLVQEGRLGYEEYAARGYGLWGFEAPVALKSEPMELVEVAGVKIPVDQRDFDETNANNYVVSESYILEAIEFGWDEALTKHAIALLEAQTSRYTQTGHLTAVSEDNIDQAPHFLYSTLYANGSPWAVITEHNEEYPELRTLSTKAAFGWYYLFPQNPYTRQLISAVSDLQAPRGGGFYAGIYEETGETNRILTGNTNGLILEILYYKALGNQAILNVAHGTTR